MFRSTNSSHINDQFSNSITGQSILQQFPLNSTISYFLFFSKEELCWKFILRYFFWFIAPLLLYFEAIQASSYPYQPAQYFQSCAPNSQCIDLKKLSQFPKLYPDSPLQIYVLYYIGNDYLARSRLSKNPEKYLLKALDAFKQAQFAWLRFMANSAISAASSAQYLSVKEAAALKSVETYLLLADGAFGQKRESLLHEAKNYLSPVKSNEWLPKYCYLVFCLHLNHFETEKADEMLKQIMVLSPNIAALAYLKLAHYQFSNGQVAEALLALNQSDTSLLSTTDAIDLWILYALCLRDQGRYHEAHLTLSKAINSPVASSERLRAMCLRAAIYEDEKKDDLAQNQWKTIASKKGHWAALAQQKIRKDYARLSTTAQQ